MGTAKYCWANKLLFCFGERLALRLARRRNDWPSSSARLCWGRLKSWWHTRTEATPQISTSCTGRTACSLACISSAAWRWWQSLCKPSVGRGRRRQKEKVNLSSLLSHLHTFQQREGNWKSTACTQQEDLEFFCHINRWDHKKWGSGF